MWGVLKTVKDGIRAATWNIKIQNYISKQVSAKREIKEAREQIAVTKEVYDELINGLDRDKEYGYNDYINMVDGIISK